MVYRSLYSPICNEHNNYMYIPSFHNTTRNLKSYPSYELDMLCFERAKE